MEVGEHFSESLILLLPLSIIYSSVFSKWLKVLAGGDKKSDLFQCQQQVAMEWSNDPHDLACSAAASLHWFFRFILNTKSCGVCTLSQV